MLSLKGYEIVDVIHQGKEYGIFRAIRLTDNQFVCIKVLVEEIPSSKLCSSLSREFEIGKSFSHPNIIGFHLLRKINHRLVLEMEYFDGITLAKQIPLKGFPLADFLPIALQLAKAIGAIHQQQIIHQAINPNNILVNLKSHQVKLINFMSTSRLVYERQLPGPSACIDSVDLPYISPEQTGRMNRTIDYRADFYSLGVIFYQMQYGQLPFTADDPLDLIYCHLAKMPSLPYKEKSEVPQVIFNIISKLLAKNAEDRYQSAYGLEADLQECFNQLTTKGAIQDFSIGQQDALDRFSIHQKLYGREEEIQQLLTTFEKVSKGETNDALIMIRGYSGIGKTALINEIQKPLVQAKGNFISGKFDQFERTAPYAAFAQAIRQLIHQLLIESEEKIKEWKTRLVKYLNFNGQLMVELIPELEIIIGPQPAVVSLAPIENQHRFQQVFLNFIRAFSQPSHPLVIFLDDLQWANPAALNLIKFIILHPETHFLYFIGAYRDNEVDKAHPLPRLLQEIQQQKPVYDIALKPLAFAHINHLIADTLHALPDEVASLTELVYAKTQGNPFFTNQFLKTLYQAKLIQFNPLQKKWEWNLTEITRMDITDNVVDLMIKKIYQLPSSAQTILSLAANIGYQFDVHILTIISEMPLDDVSKALWPAVQTGLILPLGKNYYEAAEYNQEFQFLHDRVQQAASLLIPPEQYKSLQLKTGRLLLEKASPQQLEKQLFYIVGQLNAGQDLITDEREKIKLAELNLRLAKKANDSTAYLFAVQYAQVGVDLLPKESWQTYYDLSLALYKQLAESHYLAGRFSDAERLYPLMLAASKTDLDKISVYFIMMNQMELQGRCQEAVQIILNGLALLNIRLPEDEDQLKMMLEKELSEIRINLKGRKIEEIIEGPEMTDPQAMVIMKLLAGLWTPAFILNLQDLLRVVSVKMANLSLCYGNCEGSSIAYALYGYYTGSLTDNYEEAYAFGKAGISLSQKYSNISLRSLTYFIFGCGIVFWRKPLKESYFYLDQSYELGIESGNLAYASYAIHYLLFHRFIQGMELDVLKALSVSYLKFSKHTSPAMYDYTLALIQALYDLTGTEKDLQEERYLEMYEQKKLFEGAFFTGKVISAYLLEDKENSVVYADKALEIVPAGLVGSIAIAEAEFYSALIYLSAYSVMKSDEQERCLSKVEIVLSHMRVWADNCEPNYLHKLLLIEAEKARVQEKPASHIIELYNRAIVAARQYEFIQHEALVYELYAKYQLGNDKKQAGSYMQRAWQLYSRWGAKVKAKLLESTYAWLLKNSVDLSSVKLQAFDIKAVAKAAQIISSEINLDKLLATILKVALENAGAQTGAFILLNEAGQLIVEAECQFQGRPISSLQAIPLSAWDRGAHSIIQYVKRTNQLVIIGAAFTDPQFGSDPYIIKTQAKSILCMPIVSKNKLKGLLYIENNLATYAFTPDHIEVLNILASQMVISLENVQIVQAQLAQSQKMMEDQRKRAEEAEKYRKNLEDFINMICHEIRNPMQGIFSNADAIKQLLNSLRPILTTQNPSLSIIYEQIEAAIKEIEICVRHQKTVVDETLDLSKLEAGKWILNKQAGSPKVMIQETLTLFSQLLAQKKLKLNLNLPEEDIQVNVDLDSLKIVLVNLLANAIKYTQTGGITISLTYQNTSDTHTQLYMIIADTGPGMSLEEQAQLFTRFSRAKYSATHYEGSGLGLSIAKQLIDQMGGQISVTGQRLQGTQFTVCLPCEIAILQKTITSVPISGATTASSIVSTVAGKKILIVEDNIINQKALARMLKDHHITIASNGLEAIDIWESALQQQAPFDLIFMDIEMPVMNGIESTKKIRSKETERCCSHVPIIAVTGNAGPDFISLAKQVGMDNYIIKPCDKGKLANIIATYAAVAKPTGNNYREDSRGVSNQETVSDNVNKTPTTANLTPEDTRVFNETAWLSDYHMRIIGDSFLSTPHLHSLIRYTPTALDNHISSDKWSQLEIVLGDWLQSGQESFFVTAINCFLTEEAYRKATTSSDNSRGNHWVYALFEKKEHGEIKVWIIDPASEASYYIKQSILKMLDSLGKFNVSVCDYNSNLQTDGYNCGIWVLVFLKETVDRLDDNIELILNDISGFTDLVRKNTDNKPVGINYYRQQYRDIFTAILNQQNAANNRIETEQVQPMEEMTLPSTTVAPLNYCGFFNKKELNVQEENSCQKKTHNR